MASVDLVFSHAPITPGAGGIVLIFGEDLVAALRALVLKMGAICEVPMGEEGIHPPLRISSSGALSAGGAGTNLVLVGGLLRQVYAGEVSVV